jgi:hypothetical protein
MIVSYVVNWRGSDGQAGWHPVGDLSEAAAHVEHLRNIEGVSETKIFKLDEVAFEFRQYYRVELNDTPAVEESAPTAAMPADPAPVVVEAVVEPPAWAPEPADASTEPAFEPARVAEPEMAEVGSDEGSNGQRRGLFGR